MVSSFIGLSTSLRLFRESLAFGYGGREIRFALVNFTGLSLVTRSPARWSLAGIPEHRDAFKSYEVALNRVLLTSWDPECVSVFVFSCVCCVFGERTTVAPIASSN